MSSNPIFRCLLSGPVVCAAVFATHAVVYAQGNSAQTPAANNAVSPTPLSVADPAPSAHSSERPVINQSTKIVTIPLADLSSPNALSSRASSIRASDLMTVAQLLDDVKGRVKNRDLVGAEQRLTVLNISPPDTAAWHLETSQRLMQVAGELTRDPTGKTQVGSMVTQSLAQLQQAEVKARRDKDTRGEARAKSAAGLIQERYSGDPNAAIASYEAALKLAPDDLGTKEALERLQKSLANVLAKTKAAKAGKNR